MPVSYYPLADESKLPEPLRKLFAKARGKLGFLPNVFRAYSHRPERFSAWFQHFRLLHEPTDNLGEAERELIAVVVSSYNRCTYCVASHSDALRRLRGDVPNVGRIMVSWRQADLTDRERAICAYAEKLTRAPHTVERADLEPLRAAGLTDDEVWDVVELASMYNFTNRISIGLGIEANDEYYYVERDAGAGSRPAG